jgi:hypothetical protein
MAAAAAVSADALKAKLESQLQAASVSVVDTSGGCVSRSRRAWKRGAVGKLHALRPPVATARRTAELDQRRTLNPTTPTDRAAAAPRSRSAWSPPCLRARC